jgi:hypothetical protein
VWCPLCKVERSFREPNLHMGVDIWPWDLSRRGIYGIPYLQIRRCGRSSRKRSIPHPTIHKYMAEMTPLRLIGTDILSSVPSSHSKQPSPLRKSKNPFIPVPLSSLPKSHGSPAASSPPSTMPARNLLSRPAGTTNPPYRKSLTKHVRQHPTSSCRRKACLHGRFLERYGPSLERWPTSVGNRHTSFRCECVSIWRWARVGLWTCVHHSLVDATVDFGEIVGMWVCGRKMSRGGDPRVLESS